MPLVPDMATVITTRIHTSHTVARITGRHIALGMCTGRITHTVRQLTDPIQVMARTALIGLRNMEGIGPMAGISQVLVTTTDTASVESKKPALGGQLTKA